MLIVSSIAQCSSSAIFPFMLALPFLSPAALQSAWTSEARSGAFANEIAQLRIDDVAPAAAIEDAVMADAGLDVIALLAGIEPGQQLMHRRGLADGADIVLLALDGEDRGAADRAGIDRHAMRDELAARQGLAMEDAIDGLEIKIRREIHHRRVLIVEFPRRVGAFDVALDEMLEELDMRIHMPVEIHAEKAG